MSIGFLQNIQSLNISHEKLGFENSFLDCYPNEKHDHE